MLPKLVASVGQVGGGHCRLHLRCPRERFFASMDAANVDLKAFSEDFYRQDLWRFSSTGAGNAALSQKRDRCMVRVDDFADSRPQRFAHELQQMTQWVVDNLGPAVPMHFTAFHPDWKMRDIRQHPGGQPDACQGHRHQQRRTLCLHRQCSRQQWRQHLVSPMWIVVD